MFIADETTLDYDLFHLWPDCGTAQRCHIRFVSSGQIRRERFSNYLILIFAQYTNIHSCSASLPERWPTDGLHCTQWNDPGDKALDFHDNLCVCVCSAMWIRALVCSFVCILCVCVCVLWLNKCCKRTFGLSSLHSVAHNNKQTCVRPRHSKLSTHTRFHRAYRINIVDVFFLLFCFYFFPYTQQSDIYGHSQCPQYVVCVITNFIFLFFQYHIFALHIHFIIFVFCCFCLDYCARSSWRPLTL